MNDLPANEELPVLRALVLADHVYTDKDSRKRIIAGTFNGVTLPSYPGLLAQQSVAFILLDDFDGEIQLRLRFVFLKNNAILMESPIISITSSDRLATTDLAVAVPPLPLPETGIYSLECYVNDAMIGSIRITALQTRNEEDNDD